MNLEFRHEIKGLWGYHEVNEIGWCFDDDVLAKAFRELRKDRSAVLWVMDVSNDVDFENILNLSLSWDTWEDYDDKVVTVTIWKHWNDFEYRKMPWENGKRLFREVIKRATRGDVKAADVIKPEKVF